MASPKLKEVFTGYAAFGKSQGKSDCVTGAQFNKLMKDRGLVTKKLNTTAIDLALTRVKGKEKTLNYAKFVDALKECAKVSGMDEDAFLAKVTGGEGPSTAGTTKVSKQGGVEKLTDASQYTGSHKERFDADGKGKGLDGRKDTSQNTGYVGAYKGAGKYDEKH